MRFEVLGFAGAAPLQGACSSYLVATERTHLLLDCGPGALERLWRRDLLRQLDAIVLSHMHADHVLDLVPLSGEIVRRLRGDRRLELYVPTGALEMLGRLDAVFARDPQAPSRFAQAFDLREYGAHDIVTVGELSVSFAATDHPQPCLAARVTDGRAVIVYGADGGANDAVATLARRADLLVLEATFSEDVAAAADHRHMTAGQAGSVASRADAQRLLLTHQLVGVSETELVSRAQAAYAGPVRLAHERYQVSL